MPFVAVQVMLVDPEVEFELPSTTSPSVPASTGCSANFAMKPAASAVAAVRRPRRFKGWSDWMTDFAAEVWNAFMKPPSGLRLWLIAAF
jgi:hypothetical protein